MSKIVLWIFFACAAAALSAGFAYTQRWAEMLGVLIIAGLWLLAQLGRKPLALSANSLALSGLVILGALENMPIAFILPAWCCLLAAWDLADFQQRLVDSQDQAMRRQVEAHHLRKLFLLFSLGMGSALAATAMQLALTFRSVMLIGLLSILTLWGLVLLLARQKKSG